MDQVAQSASPPSPPSPVVAAVTDSPRTDTPSLPLHITCLYMIGVGRYKCVCVCIGMWEGVL